MPAKLKPIYAVHCTTKFGIGLQYVKALTKTEAKQKFKKRFPKSMVIDVDKTDKTYHAHAI